MSRRTIPIKDLNKVTSVDPDDEFALQLKDGSPAVSVKAKHLPTATEDQVKEIFKDLPVVSPDSECYLIGLCGDNLVKIPADDIPPETNPVPPIIATADAWYKEEGIVDDGTNMTQWLNSGLSGSDLNLNVTGVTENMLVDTINNIKVGFHNNTSFNASMTAVSTLAFSPPYTVIIIARDNGNFSSRDHTLTNASGGCVIQTRQSAPRRWKLNQNVLEVDYDNNLHMFVAQMNGDGTSRFYVSDIGEEIADYGSGDLGTISLFGGNSVHAMQGWICEAVYKNASVSLSELQQAESYYKTRFNFGTP